MGRRFIGLAALLAALGFVVFGPVAHAAQRTATNGILTVTIEDAGSSAGMFTVSTGASHPTPGETVFYPIGTSYVTLRDVTAQEIWTNAGGVPTDNVAPFVSRSMQAAPATSATTNITGGFRTVYTLPNWVVTQDVVINGTSLQDTNVRQTLTVQNTSATARAYGVRYMWDWQIAGNDASIFRTRNPDGAFTSTFAAFNLPGFQAFEEVDNPATPTFSVFGTVTGGTLVPAPTTPDRLVYVDWGDFYDAPWDRTIAGSGGDSATAHFWGFTAPLQAAAGATATFHQYVSTNPTAVGVGPPTGPTQVPTLSQWALILLAGLLGLLATRRLRAPGA